MAVEALGEFPEHLLCEKIWKVSKINPQKSQERFLYSGIQGVGGINHVFYGF